MALLLGLVLTKNRVNLSSNVSVQILAKLKLSYGIANYIFLKIKI
jgi:hypothetical protein